jgi:hypothetical protein
MIEFSGDVTLKCFISTPLTGSKKTKMTHEWTMDHHILTLVGDHQKSLEQLPKESATTWP